MRQPLAIHEDERRITIDAGAIRVVVSKTTFSVIHGVALNDGSGVYTPILGPGEIRTIEHTGAEYLATRTPPRDYEVEIQERGPVVAQLRMEGGHYDASNKKLFDSIVWLWVYAGQSQLKLFHTLVHQDAEPANLPLTREMAELIAPQTSKKTRGRPVVGRDKIVSALRGWTIDFPWAGGASPETWSSGVDGQRVSGSIGSGFVLQQTGDLWKEAAKLNGVSAGRHVQGWLRVAGGPTTVSTAIRHFAQTYPKAVSVDKEGLSLELCSPRSGRPEFLNIISGVAKSHQIMLDFRWPEHGRAAETTARYFLEGPRPKMDSSWVRATDVFFLFAEADERTRTFDAALSRTWSRSSYDAPPPRMGVDWGGAFGVRGIKHYGDFFDTGKVGAKGRWNNHYSLPRELLYHWLRTAEHYSFSSAEAGVWHYMDVDVQHSPGPNRRNHNVPGARWTHYGSDHQGAESGNHWWLGGLPEYYLLTGHPRAREVLEENAAYLLAAEGVKYGHQPRTPDPAARRALAQRTANGHAGSDAYRTWSMSSIACTLLYETLGDERLFDSASNGVGFLVDLWRGPWPILVKGQTLPGAFEPPRGLWVQIVKSETKSKDTRGISAARQYHRPYELVLRYAKWNEYLARFPQQLLVKMVAQNLDWYHDWFWRPGPRFHVGPRDPGTIYYWNAKTGAPSVRPNPARERPSVYIAPFFVEMGHRLGRPEWVEAGMATMDARLTKLSKYANLNKYGQVTVRNEYLAACQNADDSVGRSAPAGR
jgi:hypothetical protein